MRKEKSRSTWLGSICGQTCYCSAMAHYRTRHRHLPPHLHMPPFGKPTSNYIFHYCVMLYMASFLFYIAMRLCQINIPSFSKIWNVTKRGKIVWALRFNLYFKLECKTIQSWQTKNFRVSRSLFVTTHHDETSLHPQTKNISFLVYKIIIGILNKEFVQNLGYESEEDIHFILIFNT